MHCAPAFDSINIAERPTSLQHPKNVINKYQKTFYIVKTIQKYQVFYLVKFKHKKIGFKL